MTIEFQTAFPRSQKSRRHSPTRTLTKECTHDDQPGPTLTRVALRGPSGKDGAFGAFCVANRTIRGNSFPWLTVCSLFLFAKASEDWRSRFGMGRVRRPTLQTHVPNSPSCVQFKRGVPVTDSADLANLADLVNFAKGVRRTRIGLLRSQIPEGTETDKKDERYTGQEAWRMADDYSAVYLVVV